jgi:hypothetical protein
MQKPHRTLLTLAMAGASMIALVAAPQAAGLTSPNYAITFVN